MPKKDSQVSHTISLISLAQWFHLLPRMTVFEGFFESLLADMRITVRAANARMTKHFLNDAQIGSIIEKMGSEGVAHRTGRDRFCDSCSLCIVFDLPPDHDPINAPASFR